MEFTCHEVGKYCDKNGVLTIPEEFTEIAKGTGKDNPNIKEVNIKSNNINIVREAFKGCGLEKLGISGKVDIIGDRAFIGCQSLKEVIIKGDIDKIGIKAFSGCRLLESVSITGNVGTIDGEAFGLCAALRRVTIFGNVKNINGMAFDSCSSLKSIYIGKGVGTVEKGAFSDCTYFEKINIEGNKEVLAEEEWLKIN